MSDLAIISRKHLALRAKLDEVGFRYETMAASVGLAKARVEVEPTVMGVLDELQRREHERAVGAYEELLTLFLQDVLPGHREVVMNLGTERGLPALDVFLRKGPDMPLEDALNGTGGSVTNILSAGLRFIALIRSGRRPFLVLDEPDCWIKPELAPGFAAVVQSVAEQLGVQVLMISHHDEQVFETILPHRLRLEHNGSNLISKWAPTSAIPDWADDQKGLRSIELVNFQAHAHTIIPLSPGLTLLNGDNDIGKSAVVSALRGVFDADSNDQYIRHGQKSAKVFVDFGPEHVLSWERFRKGSQKVVYELRQAGISHDHEPIHRSIGARDVPEWVADFGIGRIDGLDVQLANQQEPVFLLAKSPKERAKALAVGGENAHVQEMLALDKQELSEARAEVRTGEKQMETLHRARQVLQPLEKRDSIIQALEDTSRDIEKTQAEYERGLALAARWRAGRTRAQALSAIATPMPVLPQPPQDDKMALSMLPRWRKAISQAAALRAIELRDLPQAIPAIEPAPTDLGRRWKIAHARAQALSAIQSTTLAQPPQLTTANETTVAGRWKAAAVKVAALNRINERPLPAYVVLDDSTLLRAQSTMQRWSESHARAEQAAREEEDISVQMKQVQAELDTIGLSCPTCGQALPTGHAHSLPHPPAR